MIKLIQISFRYKPLTRRGEFRRMEKKTQCKDPPISKRPMADGERPTHFGGKKNSSTPWKKEKAQTKRRLYYSNHKKASVDPCCCSERTASQGSDAAGTVLVYGQYGQLAGGNPGRRHSGVQPHRRGNGIHAFAIFDCVTDAQRQSEGAAAPQTVDLTGYHILLCEGHPLNREIARRMLSAKRAKVTAAEAGRAWSCLRHRRRRSMERR